jgi:hypothetical protein
MRDFIVGLPVALGLAASVWAAVEWRVFSYWFVGTIAVLGFIMCAAQSGQAIREWRNR